MSELLNSSGLSLTRAMEDIKRIQIETKELELRENVSKIMDLMLIDINNNLYIFNKKDIYNKIHICYIIFVN